MLIFHFSFQAMEDASGVPFAIAGTSLAAGLAATLVATDPSKRRERMTELSGGDEKESVKNYFETKGLERWRKIYGDTDDVNKVQLDIRTGHAVTVEKTLGWLKVLSSLSVSFLPPLPRFLLLELKGGREEEEEEEKRVVFSLVS